MKPIKIVLTFLVIIITLGSCATEETRRRNDHDKKLRLELVKYSDILDIASSKIYFIGGDYNFWHSTRTRLLMSLFLKPSSNNRETITAVRDELIAYFENSRESYPVIITIEFVLGESNILYRVYRHDRLNWPSYEWFEQWRNSLSDGGFPYLLSDNPDMGTPFMRRTIHNEELGKLLEKCSDVIDIEQSGAFHSGTNLIGINIYSMDYPIPEEIEQMIVNDLLGFFDNNYEKIRDEYGPFNMMKIDWFYSGRRTGTFRFEYFEYNEQKERWGRIKLTP
jgi:hypothetical protein